MDDYPIHLMKEFAAGRLNRRELLRRASVAGIALGAFSVVPSKKVVAQTPKRGGTIRLAAQIPGKDPEPVTASNAGEVFTFQPSLEYYAIRARTGRSIRGWRLRGGPTQTRRRGYSRSDRP